MHIKLLTLLALTGSAYAGVKCCKDMTGKGKCGTGNQCELGKLFVDESTGNVTVDTTTKCMMFRPDGVDKVFTLCVPDINCHGAGPECKIVTNDEQTMKMKACCCDDKDKCNWGEDIDKKNWGQRLAVNEWLCLILPLVLALLHSTLL